jgi:hypothetical protein
MSTARPLCIVCGKPIAKRVTSYWFREARPAFTLHGRDYPAKAPGDREGESMITLYVDKLPTTKEEAARHVNGQPISFGKGVGGTIANVNTWDGETYADPYFHSQTCAARQGYASAQHGHRYTWKEAE